MSEAQANRENGDVSGDEGINLKGGEIAAIVAGALFAVFGVILAVRTSTRKRRSAGGAGNGSTPPSKLDSVVVGGTNPMRTGKSGTAAAIDMKGIGMAAGTKTGSAHIPAAKKAPVPLVAVKKTSVAAGATTEPRTVSAHQPVAKKIVTTAVVVKKASTTASSAAGASKETLDPTPVAKTPAPPVAEGKAGRAPVVKSTPPAAPAATSVVVNPAAIQVLEKLKKKVLFHKVELTIAALLLTSLGLWIGALAAPTWATFVHPDGEDGSGTFRDIMKMLGHDPFKATLGPFKYAYDGPSIRTTIRVGSWSMPLPSVLTDFGLEESGDSAVFVDDWCDDNLSSALNLVFKGAQDGISGAASSAFSSIFGDGGGGNTETGQLGEGCSESKAGIWCARIFGVLAALMTALAIYRLWNVGVDADYLKSRCWSSAALQALALALFAVFLGGYDKSAPGDVEWEIGPGFKAGIAAAVLAVVAPLLERFEPGT